MTTRRLKRPRDPIQLGKLIVDIATGQIENRIEDNIEDNKDPVASELGRLGGLKGGAARAAALTPKKRREIEKRAARARWAKKPDPVS
jgi:hypothetical protein